MRAWTLSVAFFRSRNGPWTGSQPTMTFFRNGHHRSEHEVLMDHADAQGNGLSGPANRNRLSIHQNFSRIRVVMP